MPRFIKECAISLIDGSIEAYYLALYGITLPSINVRRKPETKYAPVIGLLGSSIELLVKACIVQAKGVEAMYADKDIAKGVFRFGTEVIEEFRVGVRDANASFNYIWKNPNDIAITQKRLLSYVDKFRLLQDLRAKGLHAGIGCSRDVAVSIATDVYEFYMLLAESKKLKAYLKNVSKPEATIRDREAIIEDLSRRMVVAKEKTEKMDCLRNMYLVLPYIPETAPDWVDKFEQAYRVPPHADDISYLVRSLTEAHSIYLLKNRGGKTGVPVRIESDNPTAIPIAIQNIKRVLGNIPDEFNNDVLTANTRLEKQRLSLPIDDFILDLYALGIEESRIITPDNQKLTAQQVWPFVVASYSTAGSPRPCWFLIKACDELDNLAAYLNRVIVIGNGYYRRRAETVIKSIIALKNNDKVTLSLEKDSLFGEIKAYHSNQIAFLQRKYQPFTPAFIRSNPTSDTVSSIVGDYISNSISTGTALERILLQKSLTSNDLKVAKIMMDLCRDGQNRNGLLAVLRTNHLTNYKSQARKMMFFIDFIDYGPNI